MAHMLVIQLILVQEREVCGPSPLQPDCAYFQIKLQSSPKNLNFVFQRSFIMSDF